MEKQDIGEAVAAEELTGFGFVGICHVECDGRARDVAIFKHAATGLEFSLVPGGPISVAWNRPPSVDADPAPATYVGPILAARTELPQRAWETCEVVNPSKFVGEEMPVDSVTWWEASQFCAQYGWSLPSHEEWMHLAVDLVPTRHCFGDGPLRRLREYAWFEATARGSTHRVGMKKPNVWGLHDVQGNVWEWCEDEVVWGTQRALAGQGWDTEDIDVDLRRFGSEDPVSRRPIVGFRPIVRLGASQRGR